MKETYIITVKRPTGATVGATKAFIRDALESYGGQFDPDDPLFYSLAVFNVTKGLSRKRKTKTLQTNSRTKEQVT